jgi:hypothetical protein
MSKLQTPKSKTTPWNEVDLTRLVTAYNALKKVQSPRARAEARKSADRLSRLCTELVAAMKSADETTEVFVTRDFVTLYPVLEKFALRAGWWRDRVNPTSNEVYDDPVEKIAFMAASFLHNEGIKPVASKNSAYWNLLQEIFAEAGDEPPADLLLIAKDAVKQFVDLQLTDPKN